MTGSALAEGMFCSGSLMGTEGIVLMMFSLFSYSAYLSARGVLSITWCFLQAGSSNYLLKYSSTYLAIFQKYMAVPKINPDYSRFKIEFYVFISSCGFQNSQVNFVHTSQGFWRKIIATVLKTVDELLKNPSKIKQM